MRAAEDPAAPARSDSQCSAAMRSPDGGTGGRRWNSCSATSGQDGARSHRAVHETGIESGTGWHWNCRGTISRAGSHDSPRQPGSRCNLLATLPWFPRRPGGESGECEGGICDGARRKLRHRRKSPARRMRSVRLAKLLRGVDARQRASRRTGDLEIQEIAYDSRKVKPGTLFVAIRGEKTDGNKFVSDAVARGAIAIASEQPSPGNDSRRNFPGSRFRTRARHWRSPRQIILGVPPKC